MMIDDEIGEYMLIIIAVMPLRHGFPNPDLKCGSNLQAYPLHSVPTVTDDFCFTGLWIN